MGRRRGALAFSTCHTVVAVACFAGIIGVSVVTVQPVFALLSLAFALVYSVLVRGWRATVSGLRWQLPLIALVSLANPLFSASGSTIVAKLGPMSVYAESLAYGAVMGAVLVAVVLWFEDAATVLTQDRLLSLVGGRARSLPIVLAIASQLVPQLLERSRVVSSVSDACTAAGPRPSGRRALVRTSSLLLGWSLEDSIDRSDAMRARGWESGMPRTSYRLERFSDGDALELAAVIGLTALSLALALVAAAQWRFYPTMPRLVLWWGYLPFALLAFLPSASELLERARERSLA